MLKCILAGVVPSTRRLKFMLDVDLFGLVGEMKNGFLNSVLENISNI